MDKIHIVYGDSAAGSLKYALRLMKKTNEEKVIVVRDIFSIGPLNDIHARKGWMQEHIFRDVDESYFPLQSDQLQSLQDDVSVCIWISDSAHEQVGLRFVMNELKNAQNPIQIVNVSTQFKPIEPWFVPRTTGEVISEQLIKMMPYCEPVTKLEKTRYVNEWQQLSKTKNVLRYLEEDMIISTEANYYDDFIIECAEFLHREKLDRKEEEPEEFMKAARFVGEAYGKIENHIGDAFIEYRLRELITNGLFEVKGDTSAMHLYSVKLKAAFM
ncbi:DUF1835 domain-containing protein [Viridibacillus arvi]|uniref:DUF1835 domain-containing protein n=1 Tax=Viridibacillus arvi TaxID=263475 RepID=UPI003D27C7C8